MQRKPRTIRVGDPFSGASPSDVTVVLTTAPTVDVATSLAERLLDAGLIACANIVPGVRSLYRWKDEVQRDDEVLVLMKSTATIYTRLEAFLAEAHPYDVPEILSVPVSAGFAPYVSWIREEVSGTDE